MEHPETARDAGNLLAAFAKELMVVHRHFRSYPPGHPMVENALQKAVETYGRLMEQLGTISLAIAKEHLVAEILPLDKKNPFLRQTAQMFFRHGIGLVTFSAGLSTEELTRVLVLLNSKREELPEGIEAAWEAADLPSIAIRSIRYDIFTTTGSDQSDPLADLLWERVARGLLEDSFSPEGQAGDVLDPEILAQILNGKCNDEEPFDVEPVIQLLLQEEQTFPNRKIPPSIYQRLASFIGQLTPVLRDQFLQSAVGALRPDGSSPVEDILGAMRRESVLGMLQEVNRSETRMSAVLVGLLQKLAYGSSSGRGEQVEAAMETISSIFTEHSSEQYIPEAYQRKLQSIIASHELSANEFDAGTLLDTLDPYALELRVGDVILQLAIHGGEKEGLERLAESMEEMCSCRLQTGQYDQVLDIIRRVDADQFPREFRDRFRAIITRTEFLQEVLNGLGVWGKTRYPAIRELICTLGHPFIGPLLDSLAVEENISIRRFIINQLVELGPQAKDEVLARLDSGPWYYLRNLLIVLRSMAADSSLAVHVRPLLNHQNETVRQEALRTLQHVGDPYAQRRIAADLGSNDRSLIMTALNVAGKTRSPDIFRKILALATQGGLSQAEVELRCAAVRALGEIGAVAALPELVNVLHSSSLLRSKALTRLKSEIIRSLGSYPHAKAVPLLKALVQENHALSPEAAETLKALKENS